MQLTGANVFIDKEAGQLSVYLLCNLWLISYIRDFERRQLSRLSGRCRSLHQVDLDVFAELEDLVIGRAEEQPLVEVQVIDDLQESSAAQHLLCDGLQTFCQVHLYVRQDELLRHFLLFDEDHRL